MKFYKDAAGAVYAYEGDGSQDNIIPTNQVAITQVEADSLRFAPKTLADAQAQQIAMLSAACQAQILAGFSSSALGSAHTYPAKPTDQQNLTASVVASLMPGLIAGWTTPFWCADSTGAWSYAPHTAAQIQLAGQDGKAAVLAALSKNATLAAQVIAATTIAAVRSVVW